jgi:UDP-N-acetylmuramoyl-L-alanyl-D-glutamate--2,6-diaminopimelate ligase
MKLQTLIANLEYTKIIGNKEQEITGLCSHSKQLLFGNLFVAKRGCQEAHIEEAVANGAVGVVTELYNPFLSEHIVQLVTKDVDAMEIELAKRFYQQPSTKLFTVGVTGTNGKTTTTYLIKYLCEKLKQKVGLIGTNEYLIHKRSLPSMRTTPDLFTIQKLLREMVKNECSSVAMEVSSHGLDQNRVALIDFDVAIFTNLTQDHFDYHGDFETYFKAKAKLFQGLTSTKVAVLPDEGIWAERLKQLTRARVITYGFSKKATVRAENIVLSFEKSSFEVHFEETSARVELTLSGRFNILNYLAALAALLSQGYKLSDLTTGGMHIPPVTGRMERVINDAGYKVFVDYAHTPDALETVLRALREYSEGSLFVVFGCGGNRDPLKRPLMGAVAETYADRVIVTSDNPRSEDPALIVRAIVSGMKGTRHTVELDRRKAIKLALQEATPKDLILIAGKGHETYQIFAHQTIDFDDRVQVTNLLNEAKCCV